MLIVSAGFVEVLFPSQTSSSPGLKAFSPLGHDANARTSYDAMLTLSSDLTPSSCGDPVAGHL